MREGRPSEPSIGRARGRASGRRKRAETRQAGTIHAGASRSCCRYDLTESAWDPREMTMHPFRFRSPPRSRCTNDAYYHVLSASRSGAPTRGLTSPAERDQRLGTCPLVRLGSRGRSSYPVIRGCGRQCGVTCSSFTVLLQGENFRLEPADCGTTASYTAFRSVLRALKGELPVLLVPIYPPPASEVLSISPARRDGKGWSPAITDQIPPFGFIHRTFTQLSTRRLDVGPHD